MPVRRPNRRPRHTRDILLQWPNRLNMCRLPAPTQNYGLPRTTANRQLQQLPSLENLTIAQSCRPKQREHPINRPPHTPPPRSMRLRRRTTCLAHPVRLIRRLRRGQQLRNIPQRRHTTLYLVRRVTTRKQRRDQKPQRGLRLRPGRKPLRSRLRRTHLPCLEARAHSIRQRRDQRLVQ